MDTINGFEFKQRKYMPVFPKENGQDAEAELEKLRTQLANLQRQ